MGRGRPPPPGPPVTGPGSAIIDKNLTLDLPTVIKCVQEHHTLNRTQTSSYTLSPFKDIGVQDGEGANNYSRGAKKQKKIFCNEFLKLSFSQGMFSPIYFCAFSTLYRLFRITKFNFYPPPNNHSSNLPINLKEKWEKGQ